jgi:hypothetical protein
VIFLFFKDNLCISTYEKVNSGRLSLCLRRIYTEGKYNL